MKTRKGSRDGS